MKHRQISLADMTFQTTSWFFPLYEEKQRDLLASAKALGSIHMIHGGW